MRCYSRCFLYFFLARQCCNEDCVGCEPGLGLAVLADGMGGYQAGEVASAMAVDIVLGSIAEQVGGLEGISEEDLGGHSPETQLIHEAILRANRKIHQASAGNPQYQGMGTTIVVLLMHGNIVSIGHVGDSRLYRLRDDELEVVTEDHSLVRELVQKGYYTEEEARKATNKNVVTRALGVEAEVEPEVQEDLSLLDDLYLLCSDGLNDMVEDAEIQRILLQFGEDLEEAADELIRAANENGGRDNISAILVRPIGPFREKKIFLARVKHWFTASK